MNVVDLLALALLGFAALAGYRSGALPQVGGILGALVGVAVMIAALPLVIELLADVDPGARALISLLVLLGVVGTGQATGSGIGAALGRSLGTGVLSAADRLAGMLVGAVQALLVIWLAGGLLAEAPFPRLSQQAGTSQVVRTLATVLPPPTELAGDLGAVIDASGLPDVFVGLEPLAAPPVDRPTDPEAEAIAATARDSVARVVARACRRTQLGTAFAVAPGAFVTNAHVVAGADVVRVEWNGLRDAVVVLFDAELDVAVLHVPGADAGGLRFSTATPRRGTEGAAIGYPGGGGQSVIPAAVADAYPALGRDIYGEARVRRSVIELRAAVERGDSGGPFVLADGTIGGVVFAEARTNEDVGYALSPTAVAVRVAPAVGRTGAVATGRCLPG